MRGLKWFSERAGALGVGLCLALAGACGDDGGTGTDPVGSDSSDSEHHHQTHGHDSHDHDHTSSTSSTTEGSTGDSHDSHDSESSSSGSIDGSTPEDYCFCMLEYCHDEYHATWGDDHVESEMMCLAEAGGLPIAGMDVDAGDFLECRLHYCLESMASGDTSVCDNALGLGVCQ